MNRDFNYKQYLEEFSAGQKFMLFLDKEKAQKTFHKLYDAGQKHFNSLYQMYFETKHGEKSYFIKEVHLANQYLSEMNELEILKLFEKQYKLKKIIEKLRTHL